MVRLVTCTSPAPSPAFSACSLQLQGEGSSLQSASMLSVDKQSAARGGVLFAAFTRYLKLGTKAGKLKRQHTVATQQSSAPPPSLLPPPASATAAAAVQAHVQSAAVSADRMLVPLLTITMTPPRGPTAAPERATPVPARMEEATPPSPAMATTAPATPPATPTDAPATPMEVSVTPTEVPATGTIAGDEGNPDIAAQSGQGQSPPVSEQGSQRARQLPKRSPNDFVFGRVLGEGSFAMVYLAKDIHTNKEYAIKVCDKRHIIREKKSEYIKREKEVLNILGSNQSSSAPFFVKLFCTFQDTERLYFVLSHAERGELLSHIRKVGSFDILCTRFYAAEIVLALGHLHSLGVIHRDLKPENILVDESMHILLSDFGSAKLLNDNQKESDDEENAMRQRRNSFVGTAQYVSPELLTDKSASHSSDLWALGCIIYQMIARIPPFWARSEYLIFQKILKLEYDFPEGFPPSARDLVEKLLVLDPKTRLGANDPPEEAYPSLRAHPFFDGIDFENLHESIPPQMYSFRSETSEHEAINNHCFVPDDLEPGFDEKQLSRLWGLELQNCTGSNNTQPQTSSPKPVDPSATSEPQRKVSREKNRGSTAPRRRHISIQELSPEDIAQRLEKQVRESQYHQFTSNNLILKQGLVDKRKGLFSRRRMLLLTQGPHLFYVDPLNMVLKGEIPWSADLKVEPKNFKMFFVHTPNRTYYLEDPEGYALEWCKAIEDMQASVYGVDS